MSALIPVKPEDRKESRVMAASAPIESGNVYLRGGAPWVDPLVDEAAVFPNGRRDDRIDALAQGILQTEASSSASRALMLLEALGAQGEGPQSEQPASRELGVRGPW